MEALVWSWGKAGSGHTTIAFLGVTFIYLYYLVLISISIYFLCYFLLWLCLHSLLSFLIFILTLIVVIINTPGSI